MRTPWLPVVDRTDAPADLNGLVLFAKRRNLVSAGVPSHFKRSLPKATQTHTNNVHQGASILRHKYVACLAEFSWFFSNQYTTTATLGAWLCMVLKLGRFGQ